MDIRTKVIETIRWPGVPAWKIWVWVGDNLLIDRDVDRDAPFAGWRLRIAVRNAKRAAMKAEKRRLKGLQIAEEQS